MLNASSPDCKAPSVCFYFVCQLLQTWLVRNWQNNMTSREQTCTEQLSAGADHTHPIICNTKSLDEKLPPPHPPPPHLEMSDVPLFLRSVPIFSQSWPVLYSQCGQKLWQMADLEVATGAKMFFPLVECLPVGQLCGTVVNIHCYQKQQILIFEKLEPGTFGLFCLIK